MQPSATQLEYFASDEARALLAQVDEDRIPAHVAIIMDGNGRWATAHGKPRLSGHKAGVAAVREAIASSIELGVQYLTIYSFSAENWSRPQDEVSGLMGLFVEVLAREVRSLNEKDVRVKVIGDLAGLPDRTQKAFEDCVSSTASNGGMTLVVAVNYGARQDIVDAARALAADVSSGVIDLGDIGPETFGARLSTAGIPDPDLLVRTSGEMRLSNFLLYECAYTEIVVTDTLWPEFGPETFLQTVLEYQGRHRRYGGL